MSLPVIYPVKPVTIVGTVALAANPTIDIGTVDQGGPGAQADAWFIKLTNGTFTAAVTSSLALKVDGSAVVQPVSGTFFQAVQPVSGTVTALGPLTDAELRATPVPVSGTLAISNFPATVAVTQSTSPWVVSGTVTANAGTGTMAISAVSLPLPAGAATEATLSSIDSKIVTVDTSSVTIISSALPSGAATAANQATEIASLASIDAGIPAALGQTTMANSMPVVLASDQSSIPVAATLSAETTKVIGTVNIAAGQTTAVTNTGTFAVQAEQSGAWTTGRTWVLSSGTDSVASVQSGTWNINNISGTISLPTGASTSALQTTGNASLASIDTKTPALGQALAAASVPVVLTAAQLSTLTPLSTVAVTQSTSPWVVSGTVTANAGTGTFAISAATLPLPTGAATAALQTQPGVDIGDVTVNNAAGAAAVNIQDGGNSITVDGVFFQATQPISGTVLVSNFPTTLDTNYGAVGASTLRTASQIGNATGAALFGAGTTTAQVLRVVLPTDQTVIPIQGQKTNNNAAPGATNVGVLPALANAAAPSWVEGNQVAISVDLAGNARVKNTSAGTVVPGTVATNSTLVGGQFNTTLPTLTTTQQVALQVDASGRLIVSNVPAVGVLQTYSASAANIASVASATDIFTITGSASKTIIVTLLTISGTATSATVTAIDIVKRSTANSGGTSANVVEVPNDSANAAATATTLSYTGNPTLGGTVGPIRSFKIFLSPPTGGTANTPSVSTLYPHTFSQGIYLRGTGEVLSVNLRGVTVTGGSFCCSVEWVEV